MRIDELWALHETISETLEARLDAEKRELEKRLNQLSNQAIPSKRRPYPPVLPKFREPRGTPDNPLNTFSHLDTQLNCAPSPPLGKWSLT